jgi:hypothetical protein
MPKLRNPSGRATGSAPPAARNQTPAETQKRYRAGHRSTPGAPTLIWSQPRNGYPVKFYVYRGDDPLDGRML